MGGTVDPKTGQVVWDMHVPLAEQLSYYRAHPPRALGRLRATPIEQLDRKFDGHGEPVNSIFALACPCGSSLFITTCGVDDDNQVCPPIGIECDACEESYELFDPSQHGWDAVMCGDRFEAPDGFNELEPVGVDMPHEVIVRFEHGSETLGDPELAGREQDVFSWFTLLARDPQTKQLEQLFEWECA